MSRSRRSGRQRSENSDVSNELLNRYRGQGLHVHAVQAGGERRDTSIIRRGAAEGLRRGDDLGRELRIGRAALGGSTAAWRGASVGSRGGLRFEHGQDGVHLHAAR